MNNTLIAHSHGRPCTHCGFTLVELMVSISIGVFLAGGLITLVGAMKRTSTNQTGLSTLQDNERLAMTLLTDVIQSAGYFPTPTAKTAATAFPSGGNYASSGQSVYGVDGAGATPADTIQVRYATGGTGGAPSDQTINCTGNTSVAAATFDTVFTLWKAAATDPTGDLICTLNGAATPVHLVSGITNFQILYGVQSNPTSTTNSVDAYLTAAQVTAGTLWGKVLSVKVTLSFLNPLTTATGALQSGQSKTSIDFTRVINIMNKAGVTT